MALGSDFERVSAIQQVMGKGDRVSEKRVGFVHVPDRYNQEIHKSEIVFQRETFKNQTLTIWGYITATFCYRRVLLLRVSASDGAERTNESQIILSADHYGP